jgi:hypothetical protein
MDEWDVLMANRLKALECPADRRSEMPQDPKEIAQVLRFQKSLLHLMQKDSVEAPKPRGPVSVQVRQLNSWTRKVEAKAS